MINDTANTGPAKLCTFLSTYASQPNSVWPMTGRMTCWPKAMTSPDTTSRLNAMALAQCAARSKGVNRSSLRPVGLPLSRMVPPRQ